MDYSSRHLFSVAGLGIVLLSDRAIPDIPLYLQPFQVDKISADFIFNIYNHLPSIPLAERALQFKGDFWSVFSYQQRRYFEAALSSDLTQQFLISLDLDNSRGEIYECSESYYPLELRLLKLILVELFSKRQGILVHASGVLFENRVILFSGSSESGKSTTARLWKAVPGAEIISDERVLLTIKDGVFWAYGTPWQSSEKCSSPRGGPLSSIFLIEHASENYASPLSLKASLPKLLTHTMLAFWDKEELSANIDFAKDILGAVPCYRFGFMPDESAVEYIQCLLR